MSNNRALMRLFATAATQCGAIHHSQATAAGLRSVEIQRLARAEGWKRLLPGVYVDPTKAGFEQDLFAAWLWAGRSAVISHRSAAKVLGLDGVEEALPELTVPLNRYPRSSLVVVHRAQLSEADHQLWNGLPIATAARTLVDLARFFSTEALAMAVDCAWRRNLVPLDWLEHQVSEQGMQGRKGVDALGEVLRDCLHRGKPLDSALEVRLWWRWPSGLPRPVPGLEYRDDFGQPGRIDFAFPRKRLAIECDGFEVHGQRDGFERDCVRLSRLAALGWRVIHVTWRQLDEPEQVFERIAEALSCRPSRGNGQAAAIRWLADPGAEVAS